MSAIRSVLSVEVSFDVTKRYKPMLGDCYFVPFLLLSTALFEFIEACGSAKKLVSRSALLIVLLTNYLLDSSFSTLFM